jgi:hypothetical protein
VGRADDPLVGCRSSRRKRVGIARAFVTLQHVGDADALDLRILLVDPGVDPALPLLIEAHHFGMGHTHPSVGPGAQLFHFAIGARFDHRGGFGQVSRPRAQRELNLRIRRHGFVCCGLMPGRGLRGLLSNERQAHRGEAPDQPCDTFMHELPPDRANVRVPRATAPTISDASHFRLRTP